MTYQSIDESQQGGSPFELFEFTQSLDVWRYTSSPNNVVYNSQTYKPAAIVRDRIKQGKDIFKNAITLKFPISNQFAKQFIGFTPDQVTTVTIYRSHVSSAEFVVYWKGRVVNIETSGNTISIMCESVYTSIQRPGLRAKFEYVCRHALYSVGCGVLGSAYEVSSIVNSITDNYTVLNIPAAGSEIDGWFNGGILQFDSSLRFITSHIGPFITISRPLPTIRINSAVKIKPGCNHTLDMCNSKFLNSDNFGGFPWIPTKNPFSGSSIV